MNNLFFTFPQNYIKKINTELEKKKTQITTESSKITQLTQNIKSLEQKIDPIHSTSNILPYKSFSFSDFNKIFTSQQEIDYTFPMLNITSLPQEKINIETSRSIQDIYDKSFNYLTSNRDYISDSNIKLLTEFNETQKNLFSSTSQLPILDQHTTGIILDSSTLTKPIDPTTSSTISSDSSTINFRDKNNKIWEINKNLSLINTKIQKYINMIKYSYNFSRVQLPPEVFIDPNCVVKDIIHVSINYNIVEHINDDLETELKSEKPLEKKPLEISSEKQLEKPLEINPLIKKQIDFKIKNYVEYLKRIDKLDTYEKTLNKLILNPDLASFKSSTTVPTSDFLVDEKDKTIFFTYLGDQIEHLHDLIRLISKTPYEEIIALVNITKDEDAVTVTKIKNKFMISEVQHMISEANNITTNEKKLFIDTIISSNNREYITICNDFIITNDSGVYTNKLDLTDLIANIQINQQSLTKEITQDNTKTFLELSRQFQDIKNIYDTYNDIYTKVDTKMKKHKDYIYYEFYIETSIEILEICEDVNSDTNIKQKYNDIIDKKKTQNIDTIYNMFSHFMSTPSQTNDTIEILKTLYNDYMTNYTVMEKKYQLKKKQIEYYNEYVTKYNEYNAELKKFFGTLQKKIENNPSEYLLNSSRISEWAALNPFHSNNTKQLEKKIDSYTKEIFGGKEKLLNIVQNHTDEYLKPYNAPPLNEDLKNILSHQILYESVISMIDKSTVKTKDEIKKKIGNFQIEKAAHANTYYGWLSYIIKHDHVLKDYILKNELFKKYKFSLGDVTIEKFFTSPDLERSSSAQTINITDENSVSSARTPRVKPQSSRPSSSRQSSSRQSSSKSLYLTGGSQIILDQYESINTGYNNLIQYHSHITKFYSLYNTYKKLTLNYNTFYIRLFNHLLFILNYLYEIKNTSYQMYIYLNAGNVLFYKRILEQMMQQMDKKTKLGKYLYKYHYITIRTLNNFFNFLFKHWTKYNTDCYGISNISEGTKKIISKLDLFHSSIPDLFKKPIFLFNAFRTILDSFYREFAPPVAIYLRINDWKQVSDTDKVFDTVFDNSSNNILINTNKLSNCSKANLENDIKNISEVKFHTIFNSDEFTSNDLIAKYMALSLFLEKKISIMLITYGYSGVGKTFTIFGNNEKDGLLQSTLKNITINVEKIYYRIYEIYGLAFPYKSYWNRNPEDFYHSIYAYTYKNDTLTYSEYKNIISTSTKSDMQNYIDKINLDNIEELDHDLSTFTNIEITELNTFGNIILEVDKHRSTEGRIRRTINNRESSRSIMVYDFKLILDRSTDTSQCVNFVIMDLPGKENIYETFTTDIGKSKKNTSYRTDFPYNETDTGQIFKCVSPKKKYLENIDYNMFMTMAYLNPMSLLTIPTINKMIKTKYMLTLKTEEKWTFMTNGKNFTGGEKMEAIDKFETIGTNIFGLEILKNIIDTNDFIRLEKIYEEIFDPIPVDDSIYVSDDNKYIEKYKCSIKHYTLAPFEGYYINENIIGLLSTLLNKLGLNQEKDFVQEQDAIYSKNKYLTSQYPSFKEILLADTDTHSGQYQNPELKCQVYFFRNIIRFYDITSNYTYTQKHISEIQEKDFWLNPETKERDNTKNVSGAIINDDFITENKGRTFEYWIKETYDYNKTFKLTDPPIATFLNPYFNIITNFYVFYVVSNMNKDKCEKQIKLISDSNNFLTRLATFDPIIYDGFKKGNKQKIEYNGTHFTNEDSITKINELDQNIIIEINRYEKIIDQLEKQRNSGDFHTDVKFYNIKYIDYLIRNNILQREFRHKYIERLKYI